MSRYKYKLKLQNNARFWFVVAYVGKKCIGDVCDPRTRQDSFLTKHQATNAMHRIAEAMRNVEEE